MELEKNTVVRRVVVGREAEPETSAHKPRAGRLEGQTGDFECVAQCPLHMESDTATKTCSCIKRMEETRPDGVVDCVTECPLTHFDDNNVCKKCSSFCKDVSIKGNRACFGPATTDCHTCKPQHDGRCVDGCRPGQKACRSRVAKAKSFYISETLIRWGGGVEKKSTPRNRFLPFPSMELAYHRASPALRMLSKTALTDNKAFTCDQCQPGHKCELGDEREDICPAGTASNDNRTMCLPCAAGEFSSAKGSASCQKCSSGTTTLHTGQSACRKTYIGETERITSQHIHIESPGHTVTLDKVRILDTEQDYFVRGVKEAVYIRAHQPSLNRDGGRYRLPATFDALLTSSRFRLPERIKNHVISLDVSDSMFAGTDDKISFRILSSNGWTNWYQIPGSFSRGRTTTADITPTFFENFGRPDKIELKTSGNDALELDQIRLYNGYTYETTRFRCNCELSTDTGEGAPSKIVVEMAGVGFAVKMSTTLHEICDFLT
ncbi:hypothetical protein Bbelb_361400 [Branchiostoma belcheri]|nr:hypothetical protein Bbelb_361400 [Branchiostoma belcheri]